MSLCNEALVSAIRDRISRDSRLAGMPIDVASAEGYVSLIGLVDTDGQKTLAVRIVSGMIGVRNVRDELRVRTPYPATVEMPNGGDWAAMG